VWAADFKERREPLEGRYGWILSIKDLGSGCQLAWQPLVHATAECVQEIYGQLFAQHGPPLVLKSDNGGQFKADGTKDLLAEYRVLPLYSPKRHPQYNGGVERANGQVAGYQEAIAAAQQRPAGPTCDDAEAARQLANDLSRPLGWQGPTARQLFAQRTPLTLDERAAFLATVEAGRAQACAHWNLPPDEPLSHYVQATVDRRAIRDALLAHGLLVIHPKRKRRGAPVAVPAAPSPSAEGLLAPSRLAEDRGVSSANPSEPSAARPAPPSAGAESGASTPLPAPAIVASVAQRGEHSLPAFVLVAHGAGTIEEAKYASALPTVGRANRWRRLLRQVLHLIRGGPFLR
jgi:transposase InsO family protein